MQVRLAGLSMRLKPQVQSVPVVTIDVTDSTLTPEAQPLTAVASARQRNFTAPLSPICNSELNERAGKGAGALGIPSPLRRFSRVAGIGSGSARSKPKASPLFSPNATKPQPPVTLLLSGRSTSFNDGDTGACPTPATPVDAAPPTPAPPPFTPANPRASGEAAISQWLDESGLGGIEKLLPTLLRCGITDLAKLASLSDCEIIEALKSLKLRSIKIRKIQAAIITLKKEMEAFASASVPREAPPSARYLQAPTDREAGLEAGMEPPATSAEDGSRTARKSAAVKNPPRFKPRTDGGLDDCVPAEPEAAALSLGLTGPSEARELGELATLLCGGRPSQRLSKWEANINAGVLASAAAREAAEAEAAAEEAAAKEEVKFKAEVARAALGEIAETPRSKKQIDELRLIDLQTAIDDAARDRAAAGLEESPMRTMMLEATAPRGDKPRKRVPRAKRPPVAPSSRTTRSASAQGVMLPSGLANAGSPRVD